MRMCEHPIPPELQPFVALLWSRSRSPVDASNAVPSRYTCGSVWFVAIVALDLPRTRDLGRARARHPRADAETSGLAEMGTSVTTTSETAATSCGVTNAPR